jgi:hypothetical protein
MSAVSLCVYDIEPSPKIITNFASLRSEIDIIFSALTSLYICAKTNSQRVHN